MSQKQVRVLFVCVGNACRSQMAEAFLRAYGGDFLIAASAGLGPAMYVAPDTIRAMHEKGLDVRDHFPKGLRQLGRSKFDLVINLSGRPLPQTFGSATLEMWDIADPIGMTYKEHCEVRDQIEGMVRSLVADLRRQTGTPQPPLKEDFSRQSHSIPPPKGTT